MVQRKGERHRRKERRIVPPDREGERPRRGGIQERSRYEKRDAEERRSGRRRESCGQKRRDARPGVEAGPLDEKPSGLHAVAPALGDVSAGERPAAMADAEVGIEEAATDYVASVLKQRPDTRAVLPPAAP